jgi:hypothetical protein
MYTYMFMFKSVQETTTFEFRTSTIVGSILNFEQLLFDLSATRVDSANQITKIDYTDQESLQH